MTTEPQTLEQMAESLLEIPETEAEAPDEDQTEELVDEADDEAPEDEAEEAETEGEDDEDESEEVEDDEDDETDAEDDGDTGVDEKSKLYTVKSQGEEKQVTLDQLIRDHAGQMYIQKGMKENADLRKQTEEIFNAVSQQRQQLQTLYQDLSENGLQPPTPPDKSLLQQDPIGYMEAKEAFESQRAEYDQKVYAIQQQQAQAHAAEQQARQAYVQEQQRLLSQAIPEFADPEKGTALQKRLRATGQEYGFAEQELSGITDARHVQVLHDAMKYREMIAKKGEVTKKAAKARPVVKAGAKKAQNPAKMERDKARKRFQQTGRIEDAIDLMFDNPKGA